MKSKVKGDSHPHDVSPHRAEPCQTENWTASLIDRLNEFVRDNRDMYNEECKDGASASKLIQKIHGDFNQMRDKLRAIRKRGLI